MEQLNGKQSNTRRSKAQMLELISKYDKNQGMTVKAFCNRHQISEGSFYSARSRYQSSGSPIQKSSGFIAIASSMSKVPAGALFAEVNGIKLYQGVPAEYLKALIV
jgi:hypothetical protein